MTAGRLNPGQGDEPRAIDRKAEIGLPSRDHEIGEVANVYRRGARRYFRALRELATW